MKERQKTEKEKLTLNVPNWFLDANDNGMQEIGRAMHDFGVVRAIVPSGTPLN